MPLGSWTISWGHTGRASSGPCGSGLLELAGVYPPMVDRFAPADGASPGGPQHDGPRIVGTDVDGWHHPGEPPAGEFAVERVVDAETDCDVASVQGEFAQPEPGKAFRVSRSGWVIAAGVWRRGGDHVGQHRGRSGDHLEQVTGRRLVVDGDFKRHVPRLRACG